jgi:streptogrisin C
MELTKFLAALAAFLPIVYGAPTTAANSLHPEILAAMKRDLGLDAEEAHIRVARELKATEIIEQLRTATGNSFGGAWLVDGVLNVAVTDETLSSEVAAAGATVLVVDTPLSKLQEAQKALDNIDIDQALGKRSDDAAVGIAAYYVDVAANKLILEALSDSTAKAAELAKQVGLVESEFEIRTVNALPTTFATVRGGDAYLINSSSRCSVGFSVTTGFVSAGHCGTSGRTATTTGGATLGTFSGSSFPGNDYSYIRGSSGNTFQGRINNYSGGTIAVAGSTASATGASICRSGSTTGVHCGTVRSLGATVSYSQGRVTGLTQTNVCAEPGDSGGSFYSGSQAQGVTSGGSGDCSSGGTTYFQPVNEILSAYGLTLVRG